jgi:hypothetical protein
MVYSTIIQSRRRPLRLLYTWDEVNPSSLRSSKVDEPGGMFGQGDSLDWFDLFAHESICTRNLCNVVVE